MNFATGMKSVARSVIRLVIILHEDCNELRAGTSAARCETKNSSVLCGTK